MLPYGSKVSPLKPTRGAHSSSCSPIDSKFCTRCLLSCVNEYTPFIVNLNSKLYFKNVSPWVCPGERIESVTFFFTSLLWREKYKQWKNETIYVVFHFFFSLFLYKEISIYDFLITFSRHFTSRLETREFLPWSEESISHLLHDCIFSRSVLY
jgi:hypothetical protein